jgi:flagellar biosynthesis/type III secretory pathway M-ring protein FliF/YscJ
MDMSTFFFGFVCGIFALAFLSALAMFWWMRPYLKAARRKMKQAEPPEEAALRHLWEKHAHDATLGANDPRHQWKFPPRRRNH